MPAKGKQEKATADDQHRTLRVLCHALALFTAFVGTLIVWLIGKGRSDDVDEHGRAVLNFVWTVMLVQLAFWILMVVFLVANIMVGAAVAFVASALLFAVAFVYLLIGTLRAVGGTLQEYPFAVSFLK